MEYKSQEGTSEFFIICDLKKKTFIFSDYAKVYFPDDFKIVHGEPFAKVLVEQGIVTQEDADKIRKTFMKIKNLKEVSSFSKNVMIKSRENLTNWFRVDFILFKPGSKMEVFFTCINDSIHYIEHLKHLVEFDELTGLYTGSAFKREAEKVNCPYAILYFDIWHFKSINDTFGKAGGDLLLIHISDALKRLLNGRGFACRLTADRYAFLLYTEKASPEEFVEDLIKEISNTDLTFHLVCNVGIYLDRPDEPLSISAKIDRAMIAQNKIKGNFSKSFRYYTDNLSDDLKNEQEITANMQDALNTNQFILYYQPQYSHLTGKIVGAEALVRWKSPEKGLIPPDKFIPVFEKNHFITILDLYVFEQACKFIRKAMDMGISVVPVSTNFSRYDVIKKDFLTRIEKIREDYNVPIDKIRVEITESAVVEGSEYISSIVRQLQQKGYIVEMDDFGSGYSSLNVLKDINFDVIKLDMRFMYNEEKNERGSAILSSVVGMSVRLKMSIIAEGVETKEQADYLRDIGCDIIQGYYYSRPIPEEEFLEKLKDQCQKKGDCK